MTKSGWIILASLVFLLAVKSNYEFTSAENSGYFLTTYENYLEGLWQKLDVGEPDKVFSHVFSALPDKVMVFPTENYYYFKFWANGKEWWGNIRLAEGERDRGILNFAYWEFNNLPEGPDDERYESYFKKFGPEDGVEINKKSEWQYEVGWQGKRVLFELNNLAQIAPPFTADEDFMMRIFDESGLGFYLLFNNKSKDFRWILDESGKVLEDFIELLPQIYMGKRTNFIFYSDEINNRKILIGVYAGNIRRNNYFDGPFDQLADNFVRDTRLKDAIEAVYPSVRGKIDDYGFFLDEAGIRTSTRVAITPYQAYGSTEEMVDLVKNCEQKTSNTQKFSCLVRDGRRE